MAERRTHHQLRRYGLSDWALYAGDGGLPWRRSMPQTQLPAGNNLSERMRSAQFPARAWRKESCPCWRQLRTAQRWKKLPARLVWAWKLCVATSRRRKQS